MAELERLQGLVNELLGEIKSKGENTVIKEPLRSKTGASANDSLGKVLKDIQKALIKILEDIEMALRDEESSDEKRNNELEVKEARADDAGNDAKKSVGGSAAGPKRPKI